MKKFKITPRNSENSRNQVLGIFPRGMQSIPGTLALAPMLRRSRGSRFQRKKSESSPTIFNFQSSLISSKSEHGDKSPLYVFGENKRGQSSINKGFTPLEIKKKCCDLSQRFRIKKKESSNIKRSLRSDVSSELSPTGFTLIEILLVAVIMSVVGLSVYNAFSSGIKIWRRIVRNVTQEDINIFFEKISHDLRNSFQYADIKFEGTETRISFPNIIISKEQDVLKPEIGCVTYFWDNIDNSINRQQINYSQLYQNAHMSQGQANPLARRLVGNLETMTFQYYYYDVETDRYYWKSIREEKDPLPLAVRIKVEFYENKNEYKNSFTRTVYIPGCQTLPISQEK